MLFNHHSLKIHLPVPLWRRLLHYSKQAGLSPAEAAVRLLDRHLPNLTGSLARTLEQLSDEERVTLKHTFYTIVYLVSYADKHTSFKEGLSIEKGFHKIEEIFGDDLSRLVKLNAKEQQALSNKILHARTEDIILMLLDIRALLKKLPEHLVEEYKQALFDSGVGVAEASGDHLFGDKVSDKEKKILFCIVFLLEINIEHHADFFDGDLRDLHHIHLWKSKHRELN
ncbi:hypothetical protein WDW89_14335 [Deltaproteobacteria bacterium TL4]